MSSLPSWMIVAVSPDAHLLVADHSAGRNHTAGDNADARHLERRPDLGLAELLFLDRRLQQARHRRPDFLGQFVDDVVGPDLDVVRLGHLLDRRIDLHVEPDHNRVRRRRQQNVGLVDVAHAGVDDLHLALPRARYRRSDCLTTSSEPCTSALSTTLSFRTTPS